MSSLSELSETLRTQRPERWENFPDLDLYMDQIIAYLRRQSIRFDDEDCITSAMINNYIKAGLLPRASGKRYGRSHIAMLTAIAAFKQILSVSDVKFLVPGRAEISEEEQQLHYEHYLTYLDEALHSVADALPESEEEDELLKTAARFTLQAYANKIAAEQLFAIMMERKEAENA